MHTESTSSKSKGFLSRLKPFWKNDDDDDNDDGPKGPPSVISLWFRPLFAPPAPAALA